MAHSHSVKDSDSHFTINAITRSIENKSGKLILVQYDHNSERFTFEMPRYIEGHDMLLCNKTEIHYNNIGDAKTNPGLYPVSDLQVRQDDDNVVTFSWLISRNATKLVGRLAFIVRFACVSDETIVEYAWNTQPYSDIKIVTSINNTDAITDEFEDQYTDALAEWKNSFIGLEKAEVIQSQLDLKGDSLYFDTTTNLLYLMSNGEIVGDGVAVAASGGTGGGGGTTTEYVVTLKNLLDDRVFSAPGGSSIKLEFSYSSVDTDGYNDGSGVGTITVNNIKKATVSVSQGDNILDISRYLVDGLNTVKLSVANSEGSSRSITYTITVVTLTVSTTLEDFTIQNGDMTLYYTPTGSGDKTVYFDIDDKNIGTQSVSSS